MRKRRYRTDPLAVSAANEDLGLANVDKTTVLDEASSGALRFLVEQAPDDVILKVYDMTGGMGPLAELAAPQMETRNLDY